MVQRQGDVAQPAHSGEGRTRRVVRRAAGIAEVGARAKRTAGPGEDHHPVIGAVLDLLEDLTQLHEHPAIGRALALSGAVHRDGDDTVLTLDDKGLHGDRPYAADLSERTFDDVELLPCHPDHVEADVVVIRVLTLEERRGQPAQALLLGGRHGFQRVAPRVRRPRAFTSQMTRV